MNYDREHIEQQRRIANALERIATAMEVANDRDPLSAMAAVMQSRSESSPRPQVPARSVPSGSGSTIVDGVRIPDSFLT